MKPAFLTSPELWTRASRTGQSAVDSACAVEQFRKSGNRHDRLLVALVVVFALLMLAGAA